MPADKITKNARPPHKYCEQGRMEGYHWVHCSRKGTLEFQGKWFCKQHHPPSIRTREAKEKKCAYQYEDGEGCRIRVLSSDKYCKVHAWVKLPRDEYMELLEMIKP